MPTGTTVIEVLAAHLILRVGIQLLQTFCSMVIMYWILQFPLENPFYSTILIILQGLAGIATCKWYNYMLSCDDKFVR